MANQGIYHPTFNPNGSKLANDNKKWYETTVSLSSISDCFDASKALTASGYIGTTSARPDGIFYDQVHEGDIIDLRNSSAKVEDYNRLIDREFNKLVAGTYRGSEGEWATLPSINSGGTYNSILNAFSSLSGNYPFSIEGLMGSGAGINITGLIGLVHLSGCYLVDSVGVIRRGVVFISGGNTFIRLNGSVTTGTVSIFPVVPSTRTKSNTLTHTDIIGSPANYPTAWKQSGVSGTPLVVAEDGTSLLPTGALTVFKLSKKANATPLQVLKSTDSGVTWTALTVTTHYTFSTTSNAITMVTAPLSTDLIMVTYQAHTNMAVAGVNSEVLAVGDVNLYNYYSTAQALQTTLIGKVNINAVTTNYVAVNAKITLSPYHGSISKFDTSTASQPLVHTPINTVASTVPLVKMLPYLTRSNGKARLQMVFKEMKHNGTSWGDDSKFNIVDNVSTTTDNNAQTVLIGQKYAELPYFISTGE